MKYLVLILFVCFNLLQAQPVFIKGVVQDNETLLPLPFANIQLIHAINKGTSSDSLGRFSLLSDISPCQIRITLIGYQSQVLTIDKSEHDLSVNLLPAPFLTQIVNVPPMTWAEKFIKSVINLSKEEKSLINFYKADAYSKTVFSKSPAEIIGLVESISEISYSRPEKFQERLIASKIPPHIRNLPYSSISINQQINLYSDYIKLQNFYLVSPLAADALDYYDYSLKDRFSNGPDTVVVISVKPKMNSLPLFQGNLTFIENNFLLKEVDLSGNEQIRTAILDSLRFVQKYDVFSSSFNVPVQSNCSLNLNCLGMKINMEQQYTFANYKINDLKNKPEILTNNKIIEISNDSLNFDLKRDNFFKVPLSLSEQKHLRFIDSVFVRAPLFRKVLIFAATRLPSLLLDESTSIGKLNISRFSNWYHFNKAEGHYLGFEYLGYKNDKSSLFANAGYGFTSGVVSLNLLFNLYQFNLQISRSVRQLGDITYNANFLTFNALFKHVDNNNYYLSQTLKLNYLIPAFSQLRIIPFILFEKQLPLNSISEFSILHKEKHFPSNYIIKTFNNYKTGLQLVFCQGPDETLPEIQETAKGRSFFNFSTGVDISSKSINSTENGYSLRFDFHQHQEIGNNLAFDLFFYANKQSNNFNIQSMNFVCSKETDSQQNSPLSFFSLSNYQFYVQDYFRIKAETEVFHLPEIFTFRITAGILYSYLKGFNSPALNGFSPLKSDFQEYGIAFKGISLLKFYLVKNTIEKNSLFLKINLGL
ncbi:MAG: DUF5686 family protein [Bacillota bacterium]